MAKVTALISNFTGGELSPRLDGRVDITKYKNGLRRCLNYIVLPHGGARKRSGTKYVVQQKDPTDEVILVPFQYNVEQSYMLMFGPNYVWFMKDQGIITFAPVTITDVTLGATTTITAPGHGYSNGDRVILSNIGGTTELNNRQVVVSSSAANSFVAKDIDGTSDIDSSAYTAYVSGGTCSKIVELTTTYAADELGSLAFAQSADTLYIAHQNHPLRKLTRSSHTSWSLEEPSITTGPFRSINPSRTNKITCSSFSASASSYGTHIVGTTFTMTAVTSGTFHADMVGALFRLNEEGGGTGILNAPVGDSTASIAANQQYTNQGKVYGVFAVSGATNWSSFNRVPDHDAGTVRVTGKSGHYFDSDFLHPGYCVVRITGFNSSTSVTAEIVRYQMPKSVVDSGTSFWEEGAWSPYRGYPRAIAFYEQRLFLAGSDGDPSVVWGSRSAAYEDFEDGEDDDDALVYRITSGLADTIRWLMSGRVLTAGSSNGEYAIAASSQNEALTPSNFKANPQTSYGTSDCPPIRINQTVLYPQRQGDPRNAARKLREFAYAYESDSFNSTDITVFSEHILGYGTTRLAYAIEPDSVIWTRRTDGVLAACTYERTQEVVAWHRHVLGGQNASVNTIGVIPGNDGDELWLSVTRYIGDADGIGTRVTEGGAERITEDGMTRITEETETVRYIEVLQPAFRDDAEKDDAFFVDSGLTYTGDPTESISGLWHLRGQSVQILNNGNVETATVSATGRIEALSAETTKCHIGYGYVAEIETEDLEAGAQAGTAQSRAKRVTQVYPRFVNSLGGEIGPDSSNTRPILFRTGSGVHGSSPELFTGLYEQGVDIDAGWERHARVYIKHDQPLPSHVTGIVVELTTSG
jgi:hypothetical protein